MINLINELDLIYFGCIPALLVLSALSARPDASSRTSRSHPISCSSPFPSLRDIFKCLSFQTRPSKSRGLIPGSRTQWSWQLNTRCSLKAQLNEHCSIMHQGQVLVPCTKAHISLTTPRSHGPPCYEIFISSLMGIHSLIQIVSLSLLLKQMADARCPEVQLQWCS